jgi:Mg-chelatase subunit ChlI
MSATSETVIPNEAVEAIATVAPTAVEILKLANERYNVHVKNLLYISQQRKALFKPYRKEQRPFRKELNTARKQLEELEADADASEFKAKILAMRTAKGKIAGIENEAEQRLKPILEQLDKQEEQAEARIEEIDEKMPSLLGDAVVQSLIQTQ